MRTKMNVLFAVVSVVVIAGCKSEADRACQQGEEALAKGDYRRGRSQLRATAHWQARFLRGSQWPRLGSSQERKVDEAVAHYRKALEIKPDTPKPTTTRDGSDQFGTER